MGAYRLVFLDHDGRVVDFQDLNFQSDEEAAAHVLARRHEQPVELWRDGGLIRQFEPWVPDRR